jgi:pimeloyl-ACP methyl ester carboxylesterase
MRIGHNVHLLAAVLALFASMILSVPIASADDFNSAGVKIHYTVKGIGPPVILVHGLYSSSMINWDLPGTTAKLAKNHQVIGFDNRGHGQSGKPKADNQYGVQMVEDIVRLMDHLQISKADLVGYSMGGMIVMKFLTLHPDRVNKAVLGGMGWLKAGSPLDRFWLGIPDKSNAFVPNACLRGLADLGITAEEVRRINVPVTMLVGDHDPCRQLYVEPLRRIRPDWPEHLIRGAGHFTCIMKPGFISQLQTALAK